MRCGNCKSALNRIDSGFLDAIIPLLLDSFDLKKTIGFSSLELCAGAGGQALGLERAGFSHEALVEYEPPACEKLPLNRPKWNTIEADVRQFDATPYHGVDLVAGGVPCPPFSKAGKQLGADDER